MKKLSIKKIDFKDKKVRYGGYSAAMMAVVLAILIVVNVIASVLDVKIDLTEEKFFSLSEKTVAMVEDLQEPVNIYVLEETGLENQDFQDILKQYEKYGTQVSVVYKDPIIYPQFAKQYMDETDFEQVANGSIIVENTATGKYKLLLAHELYNIGFDPYYGPQIESLAIEERVTNAIDYVTSETQNTLYYTENHMEYEMPRGLISELEKNNYNVTSINLLTEELGNPEESTLLMYSPHVDLSVEEKDKVLAFLEAGGKAMIFTDPNTPDLPNFNEVLTYYGIEMQPGIVVEGSKSHMLGGYPTFILPNIASHAMTEALLSNKLPIITPFASSLVLSEERRSSLEIEPLLTTSDDSWLKAVTAEYVEKEAGDQEGPLTIAYSIEDKQTADVSTPGAKLVVIANTGLLDTKQINAASTGNMSFVVNGIKWLQGETENLYIMPKAPTNYVLSAMTGTQLLLFTAVALIGLPLVAFVLGIMTWLKRRNL